MSKLRGLYIGRFQPFHLGHLSAVKQALSKVDKLIIAIGSSQYSHKAYNPFTGEERMEMIKIGLEEHGLSSRCEVFSVPDIHDNERWTGHIRKLLPHFDIVFVGDRGLVKELFEKYDSAEVLELEHEVNVSATRIRKAIANNQNWEKMLSPSTVTYLKKIEGVRRIKGSQQQN